MRRPAVLLLALALTVSGCGASKGPTGSGDPGTPAGHADPAARTAVLRTALTRFQAAGSGAYESEVRADDVSQPLGHETGTFQLTPVAAQLERAILGIDQTSA